MGELCIGSLRGHLMRTCNLSTVLPFGDVGCALSVLSVCFTPLHALLSSCAKSTPFILRCVAFPWIFSCKKK